MKRLVTLVLLSGIAATTVVLAQAPRSIEAQFKAAQHKEEIEGDLRGAIEEYNRIVRGNDRVIAAKALLRVADCYRRLGDTEARSVYQRIIKEFADQPQALVEAQNRLVELGIAGTSPDTRVVARQIWVGDDVNVEGAPSADGKLLSFVDWNATNTGNVAVRDLTTGLNKRLTNSTIADGYAYEPVISPDGKQVAYVFFGEGTTTVRSVGVDGGAARVIVRLGRQAVYQPRWSPDGRRLAAVARNHGDGTWRIVLLDVAGGSVTTLKSTEWRAPVLGAFSPNGRFLVYAISKVESSTGTGIYAIAVDGSTESVLVEGTSDDRSPVWTPAGDGVVFLSDRSGTQDLWFVGVADGKPQGEPLIVRSGIGNIVNMGFTRDGSYFYGIRNSTQDVFIGEMNPDTLEVVTKPRRLSDHFVGSNSAPAWSPDGRFIAFVRGADRLKRTIVIRSVADGSERTLPFKLVDGFAVGAFGARWLSDSRSLLVPEADYSKRTTTIHNLDVETGLAKPLYQDDLGKLYPRFALSLDGRVLYFTRRDIRRDEGPLLRLIKRDVVSGHETELYQADSPGVGLFGLAISPDGDHLSFMVNVSDKGDRHLVIVPTAGGAPHVLFRGDNTHPTPQTGLWTRDGKYVLGVVEESKSVRRLWAFPVAGGEPRKLDIVFESIATAELSNDGRRLAFTGTKTNGEVWMIKNLLKHTGR